MQTAKIFKNGRSQAVRLPAEFRFGGDEVLIRRDPVSGGIVLRACEKIVASEGKSRFRRSAGTGVYIEIQEDSEHRRNARSRAQ